MGFSDSGIVPKIEAILVAAKTLKDDDLPARLGLMKQVDNLYRDLEPPINLVCFARCFVLSNRTANTLQFFQQWISVRLRQSLWTVPLLDTLLGAD